MIEHNGYFLSDISREAGPHRARAKREWLGCAFAERRRDQLQRLDVGIFHNLYIIDSSSDEQKVC